MADLKPYQDKLMELSYEDKMKISVWLQEQIDSERGQIIKEKTKQVGDKLDAFSDKALKFAQSSGNKMMDSFRNTFGGNQQEQKGPEKR